MYLLLAEIEDEIVGIPNERKFFVNVWAFYDAFVAKMIPTFLFHNHILSELAF